MHKATPVKLLAKPYNKNTKIYNNEYESRVEYWLVSNAPVRILSLASRWLVLGGWRKPLASVSFKDLPELDLNLD